MHLSARTNRAGIHLAAVAIPVAYVAATATLDGLMRFIGILSMVLLASLVVTAFISMAIDLVHHIRAKRHMVGETFGRVTKLPSSVHCDLCGRSEVQVGDLRLCPSCDRVPTP